MREYCYARRLSRTAWGYECASAPGKRSEQDRLITFGQHAERIAIESGDFPTDTLSTLLERDSFFRIATKSVRSGSLNGLPLSSGFLELPSAEGRLA